MGGFGAIVWIILLVILAVPLWAWCTIVKKAGFSPWWGLLAIVPLANIAMLFVLAYSRWPTDKQVAATSNTVA